MKNKSAGNRAFNLGKHDFAVIIRCKGLRGKVRHELLVPKCDPLPNGVTDFLACALLFGSSDGAKRVRAVVEKELAMNMHRAAAKERMKERD